MRLFLENDEWIRIQLDEESYWADGSAVSQRTQCPAYRQITNLTLSKAIKRSRKAWEAYAKENFPETCCYFLYNTTVALGLVAHPFKVFHLNNRTITDCQVESDAPQLSSIACSSMMRCILLNLKTLLSAEKRKKDRFSTLLYDGNPLRLVLALILRKGAARRKREAEDRELMRLMSVVLLGSQASIRLFLQQSNSPMKGKSNMDFIKKLFAVC